MPLTPTALKAELDADPAGVGYAPLLAVGNDTELAARLNAPDADRVPAVVVPKNDLLLALVPLTSRLALKPAAEQAGWDRLLAFVRAADSVRVNDPRVNAAFDAAIAAGLMTTEEKAAVQSQPGSRAEVLFGAGTAVTTDDIVRARNS